MKRRKRKAPEERNLLAKKDFLLNSLVVAFWVIGLVLYKNHFMDSPIIIFGKQIYLMLFVNWLPLFYLLFLTLRCIKRGRVLAIGSRYSIEWEDRSEDPFSFWFTIIILLVLIIGNICGVWDKCVIDI